MNPEYQYSLETYKGMNTLYICPECKDKRKTFVRYIDTNTGKYLHPSVGRCNREDKCGYHYPPKQFFQENNTSFDSSQPKMYKQKPVTTVIKPVSFISDEIFKSTLKAYETNIFVKILIDIFGVEIASELVSRYFIGTSKHWNGATIFWEIDTCGKVRTGKIMLFDRMTQKRVSKPYDHIHWVHRFLKPPKFEYQQCLFGEHLLKEQFKPVAIVESEKTAVIASAYLPQFIWVAVGGLMELNARKCGILKGRDVILFPDLSKPPKGKTTAFEKWSRKAQELSYIANFKVSDLLERKASEAAREQGLDIADYLINLDFREFTRQEPEMISPPPPTIKPVVTVNSFEPIEPTYHFNNTDQSEYVTWKQDIIELEDFFTNIKLPTQSLKLNPWSEVFDVTLYIKSNLKYAKANIGKRAYLPYLHRLKELRQLLN